MRFVLPCVLLLTSSVYADSSVQLPATSGLDGWAIAPGRVLIHGWGLPPRQAVTVLVDGATPHASVACHQARQRTLITDENGRFRLTLAPPGDCAFSGDEPLIAWVHGRTRDWRSAPFSSRSGDAGRWQLEGETIADTCGGRIVLAARNLTIERNGTILRADVVNRVYNARITDGALEARGAFDESGNHIEERWTLRRAGLDDLVGTLVSSWRFAESDACQVTFRLHARWERVP